MYRTHHCGALRLEDTGKKIILSGWVQKVRDLGAMTFIDLRDRYGITQLTFYQDNPLIEQARHLGRESVIQVQGGVIERSAKNLHNPTGAIEVLVSKLQLLNASSLPPFTIEDQTDGSEELRMRYRYLDIRRNPIKEKLIHRHCVALAARKYLSEQGFIEIETPVLIKSTPEGARDFIVPARMHPGQFYALPQSPQSFKQLLMIGGMDKYFQLVKCFRDEDFRADRQPEFTQIDCEMAFVEQEDILNIFEGFISDLFKKIRGISLKKPLPRLSYTEAIQRYGSDKPDIRFGMVLVELTDLTQNKDFSIFNRQESVIGITAPGCAGYTRKKLDTLTEWVKRPQIGAQGLVWSKYLPDGTFKSSVDKFFTQEDLKTWAQRLDAQPGDLLLILSGETAKTQKQLGELRLEIARHLNLRDPNQFAPIWVIDFPLLEWDEKRRRYHTLHHPFTAPREEDIPLLENNAEKVRAKAYDLVINGNEIGGGSIRIHERYLQETVFKCLGFSKEETLTQFGFLMEAFDYGAPPHGGIAIGFDRLVAILAGQEDIRDFIAFPKNNAGRDVMINTPSALHADQLEELHLEVKYHQKDA
ncbi:MAG: aspartate--tRNA ligase [Flavobacteriales bacterium AspAUS03]